MKEKAALLKVAMFWAYRTGEKSKFIPEVDWKSTDFVHGSTPAE